MRIVATWLLSGSGVDLVAVWAVFSHGVQVPDRICFSLVTAE